MIKIKDRVNKKMNLISDKEDISSIKFSVNKFNELLKNALLIKRYANFLEFECLKEYGSMRFYAYSDDNYKVNLDFAFAKIFDFENDVELTDAQQLILQEFISNYVDNNPFTETDYPIINESIINSKKTV